MHRQLRRWVACLLSLFLTPTLAAAPLEVEVLRTSAGSLYANIALIKGEKKAVLVDAPFTMADAHRVVAMVLDSGKELETIFVTHDHPDHFFAMEVLTTAFPNARVVAHPVVVADIWASLPHKVKRWSPLLGANGPRTPTAPAALETDIILLEGQPLKVLGPMRGDHVHATALWAPSIKALFPAAASAVPSLFLGCSAGSRWPAAEGMGTKARGMKTPWKLQHGRRDIIGSQFVATWPLKRLAPRTWACATPWACAARQEALAIIGPR